VALLLATAGAVAHADSPLTVQFSHCTEFVGLGPVKAVEARALVPMAYNLVVNASGATLVVRVTDCQGVKVGSQPAKAARLAQIGLLISSPDGTATDPNTSINNYTLTYASNSPALVLALATRGVPATLDTGLAYEFAPATGSSELYAAVSPELDLSPTWFLHGTVNTPTIPIPFLANWWRGHGVKAVKMSSTFPDIVFDFGSVVSFTTSRQNLLGSLLSSNQIAKFPVSFRGAYTNATMTVTAPGAP
jgi:hypothetical protein